MAKYNKTLLKCLSNGYRLKKYEELKNYHFEYFDYKARTLSPQIGRIAYVLIGRNDEDSNWPIYYGQKINYTGKLILEQTEEILTYKNGYAIKCESKARGIQLLNNGIIKLNVNKKNEKKILINEIEAVFYLINNNEVIR